MAITAIAPVTPGTFAVVNKTGSRGQTNQQHFPVISLALDSAVVKHMISYGGVATEAEGVSGFAFIAGPGYLSS